jgi:hypothetical protein
VSGGPSELAVSVAAVVEVRRGRRLVVLEAARSDTRRVAQDAQMSVRHVDPRQAGR